MLHSLAGERIDVSALNMPATVYLSNDTELPLEVRDDPAEQECGVLVNLDDKAVLAGNDDDDDDEGDDSDSSAGGNRFPTRNCCTYPLAFTGKYGNVQAKGLLFNFFEDFPDVIQEAVEEEAGKRCDPIITPCAHQLYNEFSHKIRSLSGLMDVGCGTVTAALAGEHFKDAASRSKTNTLTGNLRTKLPFDHFTAKAASARRNFGIRNEAYCMIDVTALPRDCRSGKYVTDHASGQVLFT